jgi:membrane-bound inhibitor of C-type lysozyme
MTYDIEDLMKNIILVVVLSIASLSFYGCNTIKSNSLYLIHENSTLYKCENGDEIIANYYSLSDNSYWFVDIHLSNGKNYTLINVNSASGAKFMNDEIVWWTKGDSAFTEFRDDQGEWQIHLRCKKISDPM